MTYVVSIKFGISLGLYSLVVCLGIGSRDELKKPNIVLVIADDLGYGDLASYGSPTQEWGGIDSLGSEGCRFGAFYAADSMCSPARGALLSGQLPIRLGLVGGRRVFMPDDTGGLPSSVQTIPQMLKTAGYVTGMNGKWHLGMNAYNATDGSHLPSRHGFDYVGTNLPLTNVWECREKDGQYQTEPDHSWCFLYKGDTLWQQPINFTNLTPTLLQEFQGFVEERRVDKRPFFYYFSFPHVHSYQFAQPEFLGKSKRGLFGDSLNEMHWAVGEIKNAVKRNGIISAKNYLK